MNHGPQKSTIWNYVFNLSHQFDAKVIHQWLQENLPFWDKDKLFDHTAFVAWYQTANFMDREITYKYLAPKEQAAVLKVWATQMPTRPILRQLQAHNNNADFLDGLPPVRETTTPLNKKEVYTRF